MSDELREMIGPSKYTNVIHDLEARILALIPEHPEIAEMTDPWPLFRIDAFDCKDIGPSLAQASAALRGAQVLWKDEIRGGRQKPVERV